LAAYFRNWIVGLIEDLLQTFSFASAMPGAIGRVNNIAVGHDGRLTQVQRWA
jgi:hypothetical protein